MSEAFLRFKKRALIIRTLRSLLFGFSVGFFVYGGLRILLTFEVVGLSASLLLLIGAMAAISVGTLVFFVFGVSDRSLARRLDNELSLDERVQTMLENADATDPIRHLQREDADAALSAVPQRMLKPRGIIVGVIIFVLSIAVLVTSFILKKAEEPPIVTPDEPFSLTALQRASLDNLADAVRESEMQSPFREEIAEAIEGLIDELSGIDTVKEKDAAVAVCLEYIYDRTDASSFALELMEELWFTGYEPSKRLAEALNYYSWPKADEWDRFTRDIASFRVLFNHPDAMTEGADAALILSDTEAKLTRIASLILTSVTRSTISAEDALAIAIGRLAAANESSSDGTRVYGFSTLASIVSEWGYDKTVRELDATVTALTSAMFSALEQHKINTDTGEDAMKRIADILDCEHPAFKRPELTDPPAPDDSAPGDEGGGGGAMGGGAVYGSDDLVLDPYTNTYVEYGTILEKYYALVFGRLQEGGYSDEDKAALEKYFAILYGGFGENKEEK